MNTALLCVGITLVPALAYWGLATLVFAIEDWVIRRRARNAEPADPQLTRTFDPYKDRFR